MVHFTLHLLQSLFQKLQFPIFPLHLLSLFLSILSLSWFHEPIFLWVLTAATLNTHILFYYYYSRGWPPFLIYLKSWDTGARGRGRVLRKKTQEEEEEENEVGSVDLGSVVSWKGNSWFWFGLVFGFFLGCWCAWGCWFVEWISLFPKKGCFIYLFLFTVLVLYLIPCRERRGWREKERRMEKKGREKRKKEKKKLREKGEGEKGPSSFSSFLF